MSPPGVTCALPQPLCHGSAYKRCCMLTLVPCCAFCVLSSACPLAPHNLQPAADLLLACRDLACKNLHQQAKSSLLDLVHQVQGIQLQQALLAHSRPPC